MHSWQDVDPVPLAFLPAEQLMQDEEPLSSLNLPCSHALQFDAPDSLYVPDSQLKQLDAAALLYFPLSQDEQLV